MVSHRPIIVLVCSLLMAGVLTSVAVYLWQDYEDEQDEKAKEPVQVSPGVYEQPITDRIRWQTNTVTSQLSIFMDGVSGAGSGIVHGMIGVLLSLEGVAPCSQPGVPICANWPDGRRLRIRPKSVQTPGLSCATVRWSAPNTPNGNRGSIDCYNMTTSHWYGGFEEAEQRWPLGNKVMKTAPFVTGDAWKRGEFGDVIEPLFLSSSGVGIHVYDNTPLWVGTNDNGFPLLCMTGITGPGSPHKHESGILRYDVCKADDIASLWMGMAKEFLTKPDKAISEEVIRKPIWSTWAKYKGKINQASVLDFAKQIEDNNFKASQIEIDDDWTTEYGDMTFDKTKFPKAQEMVVNLTQKGMPVTVWVHPFFNNGSHAFNELSQKGYLLKESGSNKTALTSWWRGNGSGILDVTNPDARQWYLNKLNNLKTGFNVKSFKFDAGEANWLPKYYEEHELMLSRSEYSLKYAEMAADSDDSRRQEVRTGYHSQYKGMMVRMLDRHSDWSGDRSLQTLIPTALTFGMIGYPFVLPDYVGGNAMDPKDIDKVVLPERELFIRWLQATTFMPVLQFSVAPWDYDAEVVNITKKFVKLHEDNADLIINLAKESVNTGFPIIRPMWWLEPKDKTALTVDDQFLVGNDLMVAPILEKGKATRDIYLPSGNWQDKLRNVVKKGPITLTNYQVALDELAYFTRNK